MKDTFFLEKKVERHFLKWLLFFLFVVSPLTLLAQSKEVKGIILDNLGEPLIGVSVTVKGHNTGVVSDIDGKYTIKTTDSQTILLFSYIGYKPIEKTVGSQTTIDVVMAEDTQILEEVVVVGYGVQKKETVTGAVSSIKGDQLLKSPATNLSNSLVGRLSGVTAVQRSGEPGSDNSTIRIRGSNTLGNNDPLIVIDGVAARAGGLDRLDPNEIESMSVLKDASAAIYGARAANGVILITTKKGTVSRKPEVTYSFNQGWAQPTQVPKMANAAEYAELRNELEYNKTMRNPAIPLKPGEKVAEYIPWKTDEEIQKYRDGSDPWRYPDTDWFDAAIKSWSPRQTHSATVDGGSEHVQYFVTFGHKYEDAIYENSATNYKQFNLRVNLDAKINQWINLGVGMLGRQENRNFPSQGAGDIFWFIARGRPTDHAYWPNGLPGPAQEYGRNPVVATSSETGYKNDKRYFIQTNAKVDITQPWVEGLKLSANISYDKKIITSKTWFQPWYLYNWNGEYEADGSHKMIKMLSFPSHSDPSLKQEMEDQYNMVLGGILTYDKKIGDHSINVLVGTEKDQADNTYFDAFRRYYLSNSVHTMKAGGDKEKSNGSGDWKHNWIRARMNYFGRMAYNYQEKYLAEFVWRYDASYMFPEDTRYGFFPGILLGYRISEENFWKDNISFVDYFKIRGSWGEMGNDQVWYDDKLQEFQYLQAYYYEWGYIIDNEDRKGLRLSRFANPNITWERAQNFNIGIEGRTFDQRLNFEVDYFYNRRSDILWRRNASIPETAGLTLPAENIGKVDNTGFDFKLTWNDNIGKDILYGISATGGYAKNTIKYWDEAAGSPAWQKSTGHPMKTDLYYVFDGVFKDWDEINAKGRPNYDAVTGDSDLKPGDMKFKDIDGDGKITPDDRKRFDKNNEPTWTYGINAYLQYRDFDLTVLFQGAAGSWTRVYFDSGEIGNYTKDVYDNHWSASNPTSDHPRVFSRGGYYWDNSTGVKNTYWMVSTNYLRLKNIELGYNLPKRIVNKTNFFTAVRIYANGLNLLTFSPSKDIDPESDSSSGSKYPQSKVINFGFSLTF